MDITAIMSLHQQGRLAEARRGYESILAAQPQHAVALHYLGMLEQQSGNLELALQRMQS